MNKLYLIAGFAVVTGFAAIYLSSNMGTKLDTNLLADAEMDHVMVYKEATCGCCKIYVSYLEQLGFEVDVENVPDVDVVKEEYGIADDLQSCHTTVIGNYFIEGHVPMEAIQKLLEEQPDIDGIGLPGMPSGTPGMPGAKTETYEIYQLKDGQESSFLSI